MAESLVAVGSTVRYWRPGHSAARVGQVQLISGVNVRVELFQSVEPVYDDIRLLDTPHLELLCGQCEEFALDAQCVLEPVLVVNAQHFLSNAIIYRAGMTNIFAIMHKRLSGTSVIPISPTDFPYSSLRAVDALNHHLSSLLLHNRFGSLERSYEIYLFRHSLAVCFQQALRDGRGRQITAAFSLPCTPSVVHSLYALLVRGGCILAHRTGYNRVSRIVRVNTIQPIRTPRDAVVAAVEDPAILSNFLGAYFELAYCIVDTVLNHFFETDFSLSFYYHRRNALFLLSHCATTFFHWPFARISLRPHSCE